MECDAERLFVTCGVAESRCRASRGGGMLVSCGRRWWRAGAVSSDVMVRWCCELKEASRDSLEFYLLVRCLLAAL